jgi:hypothetical protein
MAIGFAPDHLANCACGVCQTTTASEHRLYGLLSYAVGSWIAVTLASLRSTHVGPPFDVAYWSHRGCSLIQATRADIPTDQML